MNTSLASASYPSGTEWVTGEQIRRVQRSFARALWSMEFLDLFYNAFRNGHPRMKYYLAGADAGYRNDVLRQGLMSMLMYAEGQTSATATMRALHRSIIGTIDRTDMDFYRYWLDGLIAAVRICDKRFDDSLESDWRAVLHPALEHLRGNV